MALSVSLPPLTLEHRITLSPKVWSLLHQVYVLSVVLAKALCFPMTDFPVVATLVPGLEPDCLPSGSGGNSDVIFAKRTNRTLPW